MSGQGHRRVLRGIAEAPEDRCDRPLPDPLARAQRADVRADVLRPGKERTQTSIHEQLEAFAQLVKQGKMRHIGLSNETPYGVHEFVRLAEQHGLPRIATVQNVYCLVSRAWRTAWTKRCTGWSVSLLAYSPLAFGLLTGKYDESGIDGPDAPRDARIGKFESVRKQRWGRPEALAAARRYNALARANGMTPTQMALAWCYTNWQVASTIIGVTTVAQLEEDLDAWGTKLSPEVLAQIDKIRWEIRDPAHPRRRGKTGKSTSARRRRPRSSARTAWRSPSIPTSTSSTAAPQHGAPARRSTSTRSSRRW